MADDKRRKIFQKTIQLTEVQDAFSVNQNNRDKPGRWSVTIHGTDATIIRIGPLEDDPSP